MSGIEAFKQVKGVDRIERVGVGSIYKAVISIKNVYKLLKNNDVKYSPVNQRGFKGKYEAGEYELSEEMFYELYSITHDNIDVNHERANEMAVKYLMGNAIVPSEPGARLFTCDLIWNVRPDDDEEHSVEYDQNNRTLKIYNPIVIPDTAHRHLAYYTMAKWKRDPNSIPLKVNVQDKDIKQDEIKKKLEDVDFNDEDKHSVFLLIYNMTVQMEAQMFCEFNEDQKKVAKAKGIFLKPDKTSARRFFCFGVMRKDSDEDHIFSKNQVEEHVTNVPVKSKKLTTTSTMVGALEQFIPKLNDLEKDKKDLNNAVEFFKEFFTEWARLHDGMPVGSTTQQRQVFRARSYASANIMYHPLVRIWFDFLDEYKEKSIDWRSQKSDWRKKLAKLGRMEKYSEVIKMNEDGKPTIVGIDGVPKKKDDEGKKVNVDSSGKRLKWHYQINNNKKVEGQLMDKDNIEFHKNMGFLVEKRDEKTQKITGYTVNNTRSTRDAMYLALKQEMEK